MKKTFVIIFAFFAFSLIAGCNSQNGYSEKASALQNSKELSASQKYLCKKQNYIIRGINNKDKTRREVARFILKNSKNSYINTLAQKVVNGNSNSVERKIITEYFKRTC